MEYPTTRAQAVAAGSSKYKTGKACINGHTSYRYTLTGACADCIAERNAITRKTVKEAVRAGRERQQRESRA